MAPAKLKEVLHKKEANVPDGETWRLPYLDKLLEQREAASYDDCCKEVERLAEVIDSLCTSWMKQKHDVLW